MNTLRDTEFNGRLAAACQACAARCCKTGRLFLPEKEEVRIEEWLKENSPGELAEFRGRTVAYDGFRLYDQQERCQFLDERSLCRLHVAGVKPSECFWWPFHVYATESGELEVRLSTSCCDGYKFYKPGLRVVHEIVEQARRIGVDVLRRFRSVYSGSYNTLFVTKFEV